MWPVEVDHRGSFSTSITLSKAPRLRSMYFNTYTQFYDVSSHTNIVGVTELVSDRVFLLLQREAETSVRIANMHGYNR